MTLREKLCEKLEGQGMWPQEAKSALTLYELDDDSIKGRLDEPTENYPDSFLTVCYMQARRYAVEWLKENKPQHWAIGNLDY